MVQMKNRKSNLECKNSQSCEDACERIARMADAAAAAVVVVVVVVVVVAIVVVAARVISSGHDSIRGITVQLSGVQVEK
jgi:hypothetical protein